MIRFPYTDPALIKKATDAAVGHGWHLLQSHLLCINELEHIRMLIEELDLPPHPNILDVGSGVGRTAKLVEELFYGSRVTQLNVSKYQLDISAGVRVQGDFENLPFHDNTFDAALLLYSIGHGDHASVLSEVMRVLLPGGRILIWDMYGMDIVRARYRLLELDDWEELVNDLGLAVIKVDSPPTITKMDFGRPPLLAVLEKPL